MGLLEALQNPPSSLYGKSDWYLPAPYENPLLANYAGGPRIPPGSEYSPSRDRWRLPSGREFDAPAPRIGPYLWLAEAVYPEIFYPPIMLGDNAEQ